MLNQTLKFIHSFHVMYGDWAVSFNREKQSLSKAKEKKFRRLYCGYLALTTVKPADFLGTQGHILTSPGCYLTLSSSLDLVQVSFASDLSRKLFQCFVDERSYLISNFCLQM